MMGRGTSSGLPDFLLVGAPKAGTTYLYECLREHPSLFLPDEKEPGFLYARGMTSAKLEKCVAPVPVTEIIQDDAVYRELFRSRPLGTMAGEASTPYLYLHEVVLDNITTLYGAAQRLPKIIAVLRNPVEAAYSNYCMWRYRGKEPLSFPDAIASSESMWNTGYYNRAYLHKFLYAHQVEAYLSRMPEVKICTYEALCERPAETLKEIYGFLGVEDKYLPPSRHTRVNRSARRRRNVSNYFVYRRNPLTNSVKWLSKRMLASRIRMRMLARIKERGMVKDGMPKRERDALKQFFEPDIRSVQSILKQDLIHWLA